MFRGNNSLAIIVAGIAAALIWSNTKNTWITVGAVIIVMAIVSGDMFRALMQLLSILIREGARVLVTERKARVKMYEENQRTERERQKWEARVALERMKQEQGLLRTVMTANQSRIRQAHRIAAKTQPEEAVEYDELFDTEYHVVDVEQ